MAGIIEKLRPGAKVEFVSPEGEELSGLVKRAPAFGKVAVETEDGRAFSPKVSEVTVIAAAGAYDILAQPIPVAGKVNAAQEVSRDPLAEARAVAEAALTAAVDAPEEKHPPVGAAQLQGRVGTGAPSSPADDTSKRTDALVREIQSQEMVAQERARRELALARKLGRKPPRFDCFATSEDDSTVIPGLPEGYVGAWVRAHDSDGNPSGKQVQLWMRWGYQVKTDEDGHPVVSEHGIAMLATVEADARRRAFHMRGLLSTSGREVLEASFQHQMEQINREQGRRAVVPLTGSEFDATIGETMLTSNNLSALTGRGV